jgi:hypothetical protein
MSPRRWLAPRACCVVSCAIPNTGVPAALARVAPAAPPHVPLVAVAIPATTTPVNHQT